MQYNFLVKLTKSRRGIDATLKDINDIMLVCIGHVLEEKKMHFNNVLAVQLRILLCDGILRHISPDICLPQISGEYTSSQFYNDTGILYFLGPHIFDETKVLPLDSWLEQKIAYIVRQDDTDIPTELDIDFYNNILGAFHKSKSKDADRDKAFVNNAYEEREFEFKGKLTKCMFPKASLTITDKKKIFNLLDKYGYNHLTVKEYIRIIANKIGAHLDKDIPTAALMFEGKENFNYICVIALEVCKILNSYLNPQE